MHKITEGFLAQAGKPLLCGFQQVLIANRFAPGLWRANLKGKDYMEARISLRAVWFALKRRHQAVQEWNQQAVAISHFGPKNRPILGAVSHFGQQAGAKPLAWTLHNVEVQKFGRKF